MRDANAGESKDPAHFSHSKKNAQLACPMAWIVDLVLPAAACYWEHHFPNVHPQCSQIFSGDNNSHTLF